MASFNVAFSGSSAAYATQLVQQNTVLRQQALLPEPVSSQSSSQRSPSSEDTSDEEQREFVRVSSSIGRAASAGQLSRQEAIDIYKQIARYL